MHQPFIFVHIHSTTPYVLSLHCITSTRKIKQTIILLYTSYNLFFLETRRISRNVGNDISGFFSPLKLKRNSYRTGGAGKSRFHSPSKLDLAARGDCKFRNSRNLPLPASTSIRSQTKRQFSKLLVPNPTDIRFMYPLSSTPFVPILASSFSPAWFRFFLSFASFFYPIRARVFSASSSVSLNARSTMIKRALDT